MTSAEVDTPIRDFDSLSIGSDNDDDTDGNYLPFRINGRAANGTSRADIPRYMYRVSTSKSHSDTNSEWVTSRDAFNETNDCEVDIFARSDKVSAAEMINAHFRQKQTPGRRDNLVSWTSSLLTALLYIFHRHASAVDGSDLEDIDLCVLDTASYGEGAFIRDASLIATFRGFNRELAELEQLRCEGTCYFGEYLSQGALNIEGACETVSADSLIESGLFLLLPELEALAKRWKIARSPTGPTWDEALAKMRAAWESDAQAPLLTEEEEASIMEIAALFGVYLQVPVAAALAGLRPRRNGDRRCAFQTLRQKDGIVDRGSHCSLTESNSPDNSDKMPEVRQFSLIMSSIFTDYYVAEFKDKIVEARNYIEAANFAMDALCMEKSNLAREDLEVLVTSEVNEMIQEVEACQGSISHGFGVLAAS